MTVTNISQGGAGITLSDVHELQIGCLLKISFNLDDRKKTPIEKKAIIRSITGNYIGCQFTDKDLYEKEIGFYLKN